MTPEERIAVERVVKISDMGDFYALRDKLNLTDRQREIFYLKFSRGMRNIDIAEEIDACQDTVGSDLKKIREKLVKLCYEDIEKHH